MARCLYTLQLLKQAPKFPKGDFPRSKVPLGNAVLIALQSVMPLISVWERETIVVIAEMK